MRSSIFCAVHTTRAFRIQRKPRPQWMSAPRPRKMINLELKFPFPEQFLERAAQAALEHESQSIDSDLSIVLTDNEHLHELNLNYLGVDSPTDVFSFPASEKDPETGARYLGDILISMPRAQSQAEAAGHPLESEVQLLI